MANQIRLKRGSGSNPSASDLVVGEVALRTDNGKLFTKKDDNSVTEIGSGISDGDKGDITISNSGGTFTIDNNAVTTDKINANAVTNSEIVNGAIDNAKVASNAAIAGTKISPSFTSDITVTNTEPKIDLVDTNNNSDYQIKNGNGDFNIKDTTNNVNRLTIQSDGQVNIGGMQFYTSNNVAIPVDGARFKLGASDDFGIRHDAGGPTIFDDANNQGVKFQFKELNITEYTGSTTKLKLDTNGNVGIGTASISDDADHCKLAISGQSSTAAGILVFQDTSQNEDGAIFSDDGNLYIVADRANATSNSSIIFRVDGSSQKMRLDSSGKLDLSGELECDFLDVDGGATFTPGSGNFVNFFGASNHAKWDFDNSRFLWDDNAKAVFGDSADLSIFHDGSNSYISEQGTGALVLKSNTIDFTNAAQNEFLARFFQDGQVELYCDGNKKLNTLTNGIQVTGNVDLSAELNMTEGADAQRFIDARVGSSALTFRGTTGGDTSHQEMARFFRGGACELNHSGTKKLETGIGGEYGSFTATNGSNGWDGMAVAASKFVFMGSSSDEAVGIWNDLDNEWMVKCIRNAETQLQYNGQLKLETTNNGIQVTGRADLSGNLIIDADSPQVRLDEADTTTSTRLLMSGGQFYLQTAASGQGTSTSAGVINLTGYNNTTASQINLKASTINLSGDLSVPANEDIRFATGTWSGNQTKIQHHANALYIVGGTSGIWFRDPDGTNRWKISDAGHLEPLANDAYDIGSSSNRIRDLYTGDLNLSNEGSGNDVDGTWGSYTIQEGEESLFLINKRNGKKYKFNLTEVS